MIDPVAMMRRRVREFVEHELMGVIRWETVHFDPPMPTERVSGRGGRPDGRWREAVTARLGTSDGPAVMVQSPNEKPPMGEISIVLPGGVTMSGPMAPETWVEAGAVLRKFYSEERVNEH